MDNCVKRYLEDTLKFNIDGSRYTCDWQCIDCGNTGTTYRVTLDELGLNLSLQEQLKLINKALYEKM